MAFENLGFETPGVELGEAEQWIYTFLATAQAIAEIGPAPDRPQEDFERDWANFQQQVVNFLITGGTDGTYTITINSTAFAVVAVAQTATQIRDALLVLMQAATNANTFPIDFATGAGDSIDATAQNGGEVFTFVSTSTGDAITETTTADNIFYILAFIASQLAQTLYDGAAFIESGSEETYALADGQTLTVVVDGGGPQTVTFVTADFVAIGFATAVEVAARITTDLTGAFADTVETDTGRLVRIVSSTRGGGSSLSVTGGTANPAIGFPAGSQTEPNTPELFEDFEEGWDTNQAFLFELLNVFVPAYDGGAFVENANFETYVLVDAQTLTVEVDGGGPQTVTFVTADFAAIGAATAQEVAARITTDLTGAFADLIDGASRVRIISNTHGGSTSIEVTGGTANPVLAFPTAIQTEGNTPQQFEDFEEGWGSNESFDFVLGAVTAASYDSGTPQDFEDFEEEWDGNENFDFVLPAVTAAIYDTEAFGPQPVEDFEQVFADQIFTITTGSPGVIDATAHALGNTNKITFRSEGLLPGEIPTDLTFFVRPPVNVNDFTVSKEVLGASIDIADIGFGPHFIVHNKAAFWTLFMDTI